MVFWLCLWKHDWVQTKASSRRAIFSEKKTTDDCPNHDGPKMRFHNIWGSQQWPSSGNQLPSTYKNVFSKNKQLSSLSKQPPQISFPVCLLSYVSKGTMEAKPGASDSIENPERTKGSPFWKQRWVAQSRACGIIAAAFRERSYKSPRCQCLTHFCVPQTVVNGS